ncbi:DUF692 domain-containing protein [Haliangium ochraceum]|uniref:Uncharacterized protein n=1 Tax=Haliangium ochraceum (strain DSM 14365 / JCM 11303 / SMP-2) TaxID=502025 RepID=D0LW00_HALO1|nr:DUF692 family multinuclear iron-containing protein [Haliangium ochraceum]ACY14134.1 protein of unknown function DUF692 [Haliangium ochraceum DSM 14365]
MPDFTPPPRLGVGITYLANAPAFMEAARSMVDFYEFSPDVLCHEHGSGDDRRLVPRPELMARALRDTADLPLVVHGLGLSIGSAQGWNQAYLTLLDSVHEQRRFLWHSEHLGFLLTERADGRELNTGIPLPLPFTEESLALLASRGAALQERYGVPFLLENLSYYLPELPAEDGRDEVAFLNDFSERSGCGLLFDLYNFHCNAVNLGFDAHEALTRVRLDRIVQVHVAGGMSHDGFLMDVHSEAVPEPVWELLEWLVPRAPQLAGVSYELLEEAKLSPAAVRHQLERARDIWERHHGTA